MYLMPYGIQSLKSTDPPKGNLEYEKNVNIHNSNCQDHKQHYNFTSMGIIALCDAVGLDNIAQPLCAVSS